jgi:hypothetical protein
MIATGDDVEVWELRFISSLTGGGSHWYPLSLKVMWWWMWMAIDEVD